MAFQDSVDRAFALIVSDDRRKLSDDDEDSAKRLWRKSFVGVREEALLEAVATWLRENQRGRPNVGKIQEILSRLTGPQTSQERLQAKQDAEKVSELKWAVSVLEDPGRYQAADYQHTLDYAGRSLRFWGYTHWHDAKAFLEPGWAPSTVTEVYL